MEGNGHVLFEVLPGVSLEGLRKTTRLRLFDVPSEFRTEHLRLSNHLLPELHLFLKAVSEMLCFMSKDLVLRLPHAMKLHFFV